MFVVLHVDKHLQKDPIIKGQRAQETWYKVYHIILASILYTIFIPDSNSFFLSWKLNCVKF